MSRISREMLPLDNCLSLLVCCQLHPRYSWVSIAEGKLSGYCKIGSETHLLQRGATISVGTIMQLEISRQAIRGPNGIL
jgi:hypothetical protein